jgi:hypothetical protein
MKPMYRINLYREYGMRRRERRKAALRLALMSGLLGVQLLLIFALVLSAHVLDRRIGTLRGEVAQMTEQVRSASGTALPIDLPSAREILTLRQHRVDWYPKLVRISSSLDPSLSLDEISSLPADPSRPARLEIHGLSPRGGGDVDAVVRFADRLRRDPGYAADFATIRLGAIEGLDDSHFHIVCEEPAEVVPAEGKAAGGAP